MTGLNRLFCLAGKTALITGATGYLGASMSTALAEAGATVLINSRSQDRADNLVADLQAKGLSAQPAVFDVTSEQAVNDFAASQRGNALDIVINNAYAGGSGNIQCSSAHDYEASYDIAVITAHRLLKGLLPNLRAAVQGADDASVINIASMYGMVSPDYRAYDEPESVNPPFYGAAKAALVQWTRYAACEFGKERIRVNCISPGPFPADDVKSASPQFVERLQGKVPLGRVGLASELMGPVLFLASRSASFVTGANIVVDGGWTCW